MEGRLAMTAMQVTRDGQRVWINLSDRAWTPQEVPGLMEHMTRAQRQGEGYNQYNFSAQFAAVLRGFEGEAVGEVAREVLALDGWWRLPNSHWVLSQLQERARVVAAMRAQWEGVTATGEEAKVLGRWLWSANALRPEDVPRVRAMRGAGTNPEAVQLSLDMLASMGAVATQDLGGEAKILGGHLVAGVIYSNFVGAIVGRRRGRGVCRRGQRRRF